MTLPHPQASWRNIHDAYCDTIPNYAKNEAWLGRNNCTSDWVTTTDKTEVETDISRKPFYLTANLTNFGCCKYNLEKRINWPCYWQNIELSRSLPGQLPAGQQDTHYFSIQATAGNSTSGDTECTQPTIRTYQLTRHLKRKRNSVLEMVEKQSVLLSKIITYQS